MNKVFYDKTEKNTVAFTPQAYYTEWPPQVGEF
jgi:hypothetical protein